MKRRMLILIFCLPFIVACSDNEKSMKELNNTKTIGLEKPEVQQEADMLNRLGFEFKEEKIIIDINKTSHFFEMLELQMEKKVKEIETKIMNADINLSKGMGVQIEGDEIGIDLNKTKNMLQQINILMKDIFLDINNTKH
jgi:hypothetical protein